MGKLLRLLGSGVMYFCVATIIAQAIGLTVLCWRGVLRSEHAYEILAVDLQDPKLGLIRRRILAKSNALFGQRILQDVLVSQFFMIEQ